MKAQVKWIQDRTFFGQTESGHAIAFGAASGDNGKKPGPSPMELVMNRIFFFSIAFPSLAAALSFSTGH